MKAFVTWEKFLVAIPCLRLRGTPHFYRWWKSSTRLYPNCWSNGRRKDANRDRRHSSNIQEAGSKENQETRRLEDQKSKGYGDNWDRVALIRFEEAKSLKHLLLSGSTISRHEKLSWSFSIHSNSMMCMLWLGFSSSIHFVLLVTILDDTVSHSLKVLPTCLGCGVWEGLCSF